MAKWIIDRTINLDEYKTRTVLNELLVKPRKSDSELEKILYNKKVLKNEQDGSLRRRWYTYLRNYGLLNEDNVSEIGELYASSQLSLSEVSLLQLIKKQIILLNGVRIFPFKVIVCLLLILNDYDHEYAYITREEFTNFIVNIPSDTNEDISLLSKKIIENRNDHNVITNVDGQHDDIWFNSINQTKLFDYYGRTLYVANFKILKAINDFYSSNIVLPINYCSFSFGLTDNIPLPQKSNSSFNINFYKNEKNISNILFDFFFENKSLRQIEDKYFGNKRQYKGLINILLGLNLDVSNKGMYNDFKEYPNIVLIKMIKSKDEELMQIAKIIQNYTINMNHDNNYTDDFDESFNNSNFYGMHIKYTNTALSEEYPHICLGWGKMGDLTNAQSKDDLELLHKQAYVGSSNRSRSQAISMVKMFRFDMNINDIVVFFDGRNANIGKVTSEYYYNPSYEGDSSDYGSKRDVEWLKSIEYSKLAPEFRARASVARSLYSLNVFKSYILDLLNDVEYNINEDDEFPFDKDITEDEIKREFQDWLTTEDNPDFTGIQKYQVYSNSLCKLLSKGFEIGVFDIFSILDINLNNIDELISLYYDNDVLKEFDKTKNQNCAGIASLKKFKNFLIFKMKEINSDNYQETEKEIIKNVVSKFNFDFPIKDGQNLIVYGTPGCGKSYYVEHELTKDYKEDNKIRTTFYQDYTNTDFVGQILPVVEGENVKYEFTPGPFTLALEQAIKQPEEKVALIIEELNRGSAASIFGDIFQLLDRDDNGVSAYPIKNVNIIKYLNKEFGDTYEFKDIKIPGNLSIFATMNTSDQNVFTLDTAFKRRWNFKKLTNEFDGNHKFKDYYIPGDEKTNYTWKDLVESLNDYMLNMQDGFNSEDKQIGIYFVDGSVMRKDLTIVSSREEVEKFAYKMFEYLWDDVAKFHREKWFDPSIKSLDQLVEKFKKDGLKVFNENVISNKD